MMPPTPLQTTYKVARNLCVLVLIALAVARYTEGNYGACGCILLALIGSLVAEIGSKICVTPRDDANRPQSVTPGDDTSPCG